MLYSIYRMPLKLIKNQIVKMLPSFMQHYDEPHYHQWFINFIAWYFITPKRNII